MSYEFISNFGGLIFAMGMATFAIKNGYYDKILDKAYRRYRSLSYLNELLSGLERHRYYYVEKLAGIGQALGGAHYNQERRERYDDELLNLVNDAAFINLVNDIPNEDLNELGISQQDLLTLKRIFYKNKNKLPVLLEQAKKSYLRESNRRINKLNIKYILFVIGFGIVIQIVYYLLYIF